ncbi:cupin domain-containing protein [Bacillus atrophaeus]|uniref:cupin domain-containing protein n=1 Tax=Bacillus atrophaeus TaxID=1452 RepID=UPI002280D99B|nr:cupin domain-containing protein [Bacillus atrophaeus]MCY8839328.1 cupin domain-containing protein [Bacillus atrophaeus]MEC5222321.1 cupin domain-containing protein [Bacillus atrophaeus]MED4577896.1 cupin domain-containing protein [Bacillus atrophaeus]MED4722152.1 cupin domain-containing protein [Bacillus atrophaeus]
MYYIPFLHQYPYFVNVPIYNNGRSVYWTISNEMEQANRFGYLRSLHEDRNLLIIDSGPKPFVVNINKATKQNNTFRTALWTGKHFQVTLMSLGIGEDIGLEIHPNVDQFLRIEQGRGIIKMGKSKENLNFQRNVYDDYAIVVPAGTWHNVINTGNIPLKLYSIYAPPNHPFGTVHVTKADAATAEDEHRYSTEG